VLWHCAPEVPCNCTAADLAMVKQIWQQIVGGLSLEEKIEIYNAVLQVVAEESNFELATEMWSELIEVSGGYCATAAGLFFERVNALIAMAPDEAQITTFIQQYAEIHPDDARVFFGNAPIIFGSIVV